MLLLLVFCALAAPPAEDATAPPTMEVQAAVADAIALLDKREYKAFIERFAHPSELETMLEQQTLDDLAQGFAGGGAAEMLKALKQLPALTPKFNDDQTEATYSVQVEDEPRPMVWIKVGQRWHIRN